MASAPVFGWRAQPCSLRAVVEDRLTRAREKPGRLARTAVAPLRGGGGRNRRLHSSRRRPPRDLRPTTAVYASRKRGPSHPIPEPINEVLAAFPPAEDHVPQNKHGHQSRESRENEYQPPPTHSAASASWSTFPASTAAPACTSLRANVVHLYSCNSLDGGDIPPDPRSDNKRGRA